MAGDRENFSVDEQNIRIKRVLFGMGAYLLAVLLWAYAYNHGMMRIPFGWAVVYLAVGFITQLVFLGIIRFNLNLGFHDPSMTFIQVFVNLALNLPVLYFLDQQVRGIMLLAFFVPFSFCLLRLSFRSSAFLALFAVSSYLVVLRMVFLFRPDQWVPEVEILRVVIFAGTLFWVAFFSGHVHRLRKRLKNEHRCNQRLVAELKRKVERDELTGLYNRRRFWKKFAEEQQRARRSGQPFAIGLLDLDRFKAVNDRHGHTIGDRVLRTFADLAAGEIRGYDLVARYGGEEFMVLLSNCDSRACVECLERLQRTFAAVTFKSESQASFFVTFSAGVTQYQEGDSLDTMIHRADQALYVAKHRGRNRVVNHADTVETPAKIEGVN